MIALHECQKFFALAIWVLQRGGFVQTRTYAWFRAEKSTSLQAQIKKGDQKAYKSKEKISFD